MKYSVAVYAIVNIRMREVEAESQKKALAKAINILEDGTRLRSPINQYLSAEFTDGPIEHMEWGEEYSHYLVDEVGDEKFERSRWYMDKFHYENDRRFHEEHGTELIDPGEEMENA